MTEGHSYQPGSEVRVRLASRVVRGEVLEDRGPMGPDGERVLRIAWKPTDSEERVELDVRESQIVSDEEDIEGQVEWLIEKIGGLSLIRPEAKRGQWTPDFLLTTPRGRIVVEAKSFPGGGAPKDIGRIERRLLQAKENYEAEDSLLVVPAWNRVLLRRPSRPGLSVVPLASLRDWLSDYVR